MAQPESTHSLAPYWRAAAPEVKRGITWPRASRHVFLYVPSLNAGGAERAALDLLEVLPSPDVGVTLLLNRREGPLQAALPANAAVVSLDAHQIGDQHLRLSVDCPDGPAEIMERGKWGRLVPAQDVAALAAAIASSLDDPGDAEGR